MVFLFNLFATPLIHFIPFHSIPSHALYTLSALSAVGGRSHSDLVCWDLRNTRCELGRVKRALTSNQKMTFSLDPWGKYIATGTQDGKCVLPAAHTHTHTHTYIHILTLTHTHIHLHIHAHTGIDKNTYTHTHTHSRMLKIPRSPSLLRFSSLRL